MADKAADLIIVNAVSKIGAGTAQEMVLAKKFRKPVISIIPKDTHHRRSNIVFHGTKLDDWIHPFLHISSDTVVENIGRKAGNVVEVIKFRIIVAY